MGREVEVSTRLILRLRWNTLVTFFRFHLGRGREVPSHPLFHESVKTRMEDPVMNYSPRAQYRKGTEKYVS